MRQAFPLSAGPTLLNCRMRTCGYAANQLLQSQLPDASTRVLWYSEAVIFDCCRGHPIQGHHICPHQRPCHGCFWCHVPSWPETIATFGHHGVDKYAMDCFGTYTTTPGTASVHTLHMPKPNVTRVQSATHWTASVHCLHMPKPNVTRVQSATQWTASVHALHMPKPVM